MERDKSQPFTASYRLSGIHGSNPPAAEKNCTGALITIWKNDKRYIFFIYINIHKKGSGWD